MGRTAALSAEQLESLTKLRQKYTPGDRRTEQLYLSSVLQALSSLNTCFWCRYGRFAADCIPCLLTLPADNPYTAWFKEASASCLGSCRDCLSGYYLERGRVLAGLALETRSKVETPLREYDEERLKKQLKGFMDGNVDCKDTQLVFAIYEVLIYPSWLDNEQIVELFGQVLQKLVESRKMLRLSELLPGVLHGAMCNNGAIRSWCVSRLESGELKNGKPFVCFNYPDIIEKLCKNESLWTNFLIANQSIPKEHITLNGDSVELILTKLEAVDAVRLLLHLMSTKPDRELFNSTVIDRLVKIIVTCSKLSSTPPYHFDDECPLNWLATKTDNVACYSVYYVVKWMETFRAPKKEFIECFNKWIILNRNLQFGFLIAICYNFDILQAFIVNIHYIACMLHKYLVESKGALLGRRAPILSSSARNLIICCTHAIEEDKIEVQYISFLNSYVKSIIGHEILCEGDVEIVLSEIGQLLLRNRAMLKNVDYVPSLISRLESSVVMDGPISVVFLLYGGDDMAKLVLWKAPDGFSKLLMLQWDAKVVEKLKKILYAHALAMIQEKDRYEICVKVVHFLGKHYDPTGAFFGLIASAVDILQSSNLSAEELTIVASSLLDISRCSCLSMKHNNNGLAAVKCLSKMLQFFVARQVSLTDDLEQSIGLLAKTSKFAPYLQDRVAEYGQAMKTTFSTLSFETPRTIAIERLIANRSLTNAQTKRLVDSMQSRHIPVVSAKLPSRLEAIKSELTKDLSVAAAKRRRPLTMDSAKLATQPPPPKRVAHSVNRIVDDNANSEDEDGDLDGVRDALLAHSGPRSVKLVEIGAGGEVLTPEVARLIPKRLSVPVRDSNAWHKLQRFVLSLCFEDLSEDRPLSTSDKSQIPIFFKNYKEYESVFEPLLFMEIEAQVAQAKEELFGTDNAAEQPSLTVHSVNMVDELYEIEFRTDEKVSRLASELDLVYLTPMDNSIRDRALGIVYSCQARKGISGIGIRFLFKPDQVSLQLNMREGIDFRIQVLCNLITTSREHQALSHLPAFGFISEPILMPRYDASLVNEDCVASLIPRLMERHLLNRPQAHAIAVAITDPNAFTLIQGPPGTGKTRVIESLICSILKNDSASECTPVIKHCKRILLCAPSNAAVDEVARRLMLARVDIVRIGSADMIDDAVKPVSLDFLVEKHVKALIDQTNDKLNEQRAVGKELQSQLSLCEVTKQGAVQEIKTSLWRSRESQRKLTREIETARAAARADILREAKVICCTLSGSGHDLLSRMYSSQHAFEYVIIDEACQAVELSTLIPLQWGARKCVLVGDPNQLPPTILSQAAISGAYEQSLFKRLQRANPERVLLLSVQYRMHPEISLFPSSYYYQSRLLNGPGLAIETSRSWHSVDVLGPYRFFDIPGVEERRVLPGGKTTKSTMNAQEAQLVVLLVAFLCQQFPDYSFYGKIGVITPYREQKRKIQRELMKQFGSDSHSLKRAIEVSTVDGFQGQEREVIIFSCVRTGTNRGVGFLNDARRINVALTRAKSSLYILGRAETLKQHSLWRAVVEDARVRGALVPYDESTWQEMGRVCGPASGRIPNNLLK